MPTSEEIIKRATEIFRDMFDDDTIVITDQTTANDIEDWDSLMHINLVLAIEKGFGMKFTMGEVTGMKNVGEMVDILLSRATK
jgi:acyl carrier protein